MILLKLFWEFFKAGLFAIGGGMATVPFLQEISAKTGWYTAGQLADMIAVSESTPGVIAVNVATFIGRKYRGITGGILTTLGVVSPSVILISLIAAVINNFSSIAWVQNALGGIRVCVCVFIFNSVVKLFKSAVKDKAALAIYLVLFGVAVFFNFSPIYAVVIAGVLGLVFTKLGVRGK